MACSDTDLTSQVRDHLAALRHCLQSRGMGGRVGAGSRPAMLIVDFVRGFTDPRSPLACELQAELRAASKLIHVARLSGVPVLYSVPLAEGGLWARKIPANDELVPGAEWVAVDERVAPAVGEAVVAKHYASCFFATDLTTRLLSREIDTLVIAGCTTSGCVRATAVDACSLGLHTIVVEEAVGDRDPLLHLTSLFDIDVKYGDVVTIEQALGLLEGNRL
jgi:maleamate amidohydrolase